MRVSVNRITGRTPAPRIPILAGMLAVAASPARAEIASDPPGAYHYSWIGNSWFRDMGQWTQAIFPETVDDIYTAPDGTTYGAGYAENQRPGFAIDGAGDFVRQYSSNSGFGSPQLAVYADSVNVYYGTPQGLAYGTLGAVNNSPHQLIGKRVDGVAIYGGDLYASCPTDTAIVVFNLKDWSVARKLKGVKTGKLAIDKNGRIWVISWEDNRTYIRSYSTAGAPGPVISAVTGAFSLRVSDDNKLWVGGHWDGHNRIQIFDSLASTPVLSGAFGIDKGIFSGVPGEYGARKLYWITGIGFDSRNDIYVACRFGSMFGQVLQSYTPDGTLRWSRFGVGKVCDGGALDPLDPNRVYNSEHAFSVDWGKSAGQEWGYRAFTLDIDKYPSDTRAQLWNGSGAGGGSHRTCMRMFAHDGRKFLVTTNQQAQGLEIFRFTDGQTAVPSVIYSGATLIRNVSGAWPSGAEQFLWTDGNGDGIRDPDEYQMYPSPYWRAVWVDDSGAIWKNYWNSLGRIQPAARLDAHGNPVYVRDSEEIFPAPPDMAQADWREIFYEPKSDQMYVKINSGDTASALMRYDGFTTASPAEKWLVKLPINDNQYIPDRSYGGGLPRTVSVAGDYVFIIYGYGYIRILDRNTGAVVGTLRCKEFGYGGGAGQVDATFALNAYRRPDGEYVILFENAAANHVGMFRWSLPAAGAGSGRGDGARVASGHRSRRDMRRQDLLGRAHAPARGEKAPHGHQGPSPGPVVPAR